MDAAQRLPIPTRWTNRLTTEPIAASLSPGRARAVRLGLVALIAGSALLSGAVLLVKFRLEDLRRDVQARLEERMGARLRADAIVVDGIRGLRLDNLRLSFTAPGGPTLHAEIPLAHIGVDPIELFYGALEVEQVALQGARLSIARPSDGTWFGRAEAAPASDAPATLSTDMLGDTAFRVTCTDCTLEVRNVVGETNLRLDALQADVSRAPGAAALLASVSGLLNGEASKPLRAELRFVSLDDFDLRAEASDITANDVNIFLPAEQHFVTAGAASASVQLSGHAGKNVVLALRAPFEGLQLRNQPEWLTPATGRLEIIGGYARQDQELRITSAVLDATPVSGQLAGTVGFATLPPTLDLHLESRDPPVQAALGAFLQEQLEGLGKLDVRLDSAPRLTVAITGDAGAPQYALEGGIDQLTLRYTPSNPQFPRAELKIANVLARYGSALGQPEASLTIADGSIVHKQTGLSAQAVAGVLTLAQGQLRADPLRASLSGNPVALALEYDLASHGAKFRVSGVLSGVEDTPLARAIEKTDLAGSIGLRCTGTYADGTVHLDASLDATQTDIYHDWWFHKPAGMGGSIDRLNLEFIPKRRIRMTGTAQLDATVLQAELELAWRDGRWRQDGTRVKSDHIDLLSLGRCLQIPYKFASGIATGGYYEWQSHPQDPEGSHIRMGARTDNVTAYAPNVDTPIRCTDLQVDVVQDRVGEERTGDLSAQASSAKLPALRDDWLVSMEAVADPKRVTAFDEGPTTWKYRLRSAALDSPPWVATDFEAEAYNRSPVTGFERFAGSIDGGRLEGSYALTKPDNVMVLQARWDKVPAHYLIDYIPLPDALAGTVDGQIDYRLDQDDPNTLRGTGTFTVTEGYFKPAFVGPLLADQLGGAAAVPSSLAFESLRADLQLEGDVLRTPEFQLVARGMRISGTGTYVREGDLDYTVRVALSPEAAENYTVLNNYFNLEGHRLTQNDLELGFRIQGPSFRPRGQVTGLPPASVTLVSGAAELVREGIDIIDTPRQILIDLFRIGGGIVATTNERKPQ